MENVKENEKKSFAKKHKKLLITLAVIIVLAAGAVIGNSIWYNAQPKFHDLTVELGRDEISIAEFLTDLAKPSKVKFVTDPSSIDLEHVGEQEIVLAQGKKEETVKFIIVDTTAPEVVFVENYQAGLSYIPDPNDFIVSISDLDETVVEFEEDPSKATTYDDQTIKLVVKDASGNETKGTSILSYTWLKDSYTLELGDTLSKEDLLLDPEFGQDLIDEEEINKINESSTGEYIIKSSSGTKEVECLVIVQDTTAPVLELKNVSLIATEKVKMEDFVSKASDISGDVKLTLVSPSKLDTSTVGTFEIKIEAKDINGNVTEKTAKLTVTEDNVAPKINGLSTLTVKKHSTPDYKKGVSANDNIDGVVDFTFDASAVDTDKAGTYYVTYTATDKKGNKTTQKRKIEVEHDAADTQAMIDALYAKISDKSPLGLAHYVRNNIKYQSNWGGDDPIYYGLTNKKGNCYVHALILQALYKKAGYSTKLIWVTNKSHYWNLINIGGTWWHVDSTPASIHPSILMNDDYRYAHLQGRNWDRDNWPACNG